MPLLPIVIEGTANALPKHGLVLRGRHAIRVRVLEEIPIERIVDRGVDELSSDVRALFARELREPETMAPAVGVAAERARA